jgi:hypothetical protein
MGRPERGQIVTAAGPGMASVLNDLALPTFRRYARRWNYSVHAETLSDDGVCADARAPDRQLEQDPSAATRTPPPGWNQPQVTGRTDGESFNSDADSYADRPVVPFPHALHFMGMSPDGRYSSMSEALGRVGSVGH